MSWASSRQWHQKWERRAALSCKHLASGKDPACQCGRPEIIKYSPCSQESQDVTKRMRQGKKQGTKPVSKCLIPVIAVPGVEGSVQGSGIRDHILFKLHTAGYLTLRRGLKNLVRASPLMVDCSLKAMQIAQSLGWEDPLEKEEMATHSSILTWEIPWTEEPGRLQSIGVTKELDRTWKLKNNSM